MWPQQFSDRLTSWSQLRDQTQNLPLESALVTINQWWFQTPWKSYYLHWDDQATWPDPWQLLSDNVYCDVARGLGILYTINMLNRPDTVPADLILTEEGYNLVQVAKEKYILNWEPVGVVNTFQEVKIKRRFKKQQIK